MRILCVVPSYWPAFQYGGPITSLHSLNKALVKIGINLAIYTTNAGLEDKVLVNQEVEVDGIRVTYFAFTKFFEFMGATGWQFSLPMTRALKNNVKIFDIVYGLTQGGPGNSTEVMSLHIFRLGFRHTNWMGRASANAVILLLLSTPLITLLSKSLKSSHKGDV